MKPPRKIPKGKNFNKKTNALLKLMDYAGADMKITIGTRGSALALIQTDMVKKALLENHPALEIEIRIIKTSGDIFKDAVLADIGGKELFTKEIDRELFAGSIDIAVHSLKDIPGIISDEQMIAATLLRGDARDCLIGTTSLNDLPPNSIVGSASPRRKAQILHSRPDLQVVNFRGNVGNRVKKVISGEVSCTLLAMAGLDRLNHNIPRHPLSIQEMLPCAGQGIIAIATLSADKHTQQLLKPINHEPTFYAAIAERAVLATYNGNCQTPIAAFAIQRHGEIHLDALIASTNGAQIYRTSAHGPVEDAMKIGTQVGHQLLQHSKGFA